MTPTQRTLKVMRDDGYTPWIVERFIPFRNIRIDLFNMFDIIAIHPERRPILVQVTSTGVSARLAKIRNNDLLGLVLKDFDVELHGWRKNSKGRYVQRIETIC